MTDTRTQLHAHQAATETALRHAHAHMVASLQPAIHTLLRDLEQARAAATDEDGNSTLTLAWLHEGNRLAHFKQQVEQNVQHFSLSAQTMISHAEQTARVLGTASAKAQLKERKHEHGK